MIRSNVAVGKNMTGSQVISSSHENAFIQKESMDLRKEVL